MWNAVLVGAGTVVIAGSSVVFAQQMQGGGRARAASTLSNDAAIRTSFRPYECGRSLYTGKSEFLPLFRGYQPSLSIPVRRRSADKDQNGER